MKNIVSQPQDNLIIGVVLPVYNTARYLAECLDSLLCQTYPHFVVFAVNDGSKDQSGAILERYAAQDSRIVVLHKDNGGVSSARNLALREIAHRENIDLVCFMDSDDLVGKKFLERYVHATKHQHADYAVCGIQSFFKKDSPSLEDEEKVGDGVVVTGDAIYEQAYCTGYWDTHRTPAVSFLLANRCFSKDILKGEFFDETCKKGEDQEYLDRILLRVKRGVIFHEVEYWYRKRASSLSSNVNVDDNYLSLARRFISRCDQWPPAARWGMQLRANLLWWKAVECAVTSKTYVQYKVALKQVYAELRDLNYVHVLPKKIRKRHTIFSLGGFVLSLYFRTGRKTSEMYNKSDFFE